MCSVSFVPRDDGFVLAMNRDELLSRAPALPPKVHLWNRLSVLCPREPTGGTWIGVNSAGMAFSLINWHSQPDRTCDDLISRGEVVRTLLSARSSEAAASLLRGLPLKRMNPFRVIAISLREHSLAEWRSGSRALEVTLLPWTRQHWFSSGFDETKANEVRQQVCSQVSGDLLDVPTLRKLHAGHVPKAGPFSLCMHRESAGTVSYTEISIRGRAASMYYIAGSPCTSSSRFTELLDLEDLLPQVHTTSCYVSQ
jgi:Transport and Golgi organisation 2